MNKLKKIALIPARGGSKRILKKNIKNFLGKPIISYSIRAALSSKLFDVVMVSTDDKEIAEISKKFGAEIPFLRSNKTSDDFATTADVILEVINEYHKLGEKFDYLCCIYPTAPFISDEKIKLSYDLLIKSKADSLIPVVKFNYPVQRSLIIEDGKLKFFWPENAQKRSQDLMPLYHDAGQFYWAKVKAFLKYNSIINLNSIPLILSEMEVQDIDHEEDWMIAELKYKSMFSK